MSSSSQSEPDFEAVFEYLNQNYQFSMEDSELPLDAFDRLSKERKWKMNEYDINRKKFDQFYLAFWDDMEYEMAIDEYFGEYFEEGLQKIPGYHLVEQFEKLKKFKKDEWPDAQVYKEEDSFYSFFESFEQKEDNIKQLQDMAIFYGIKKYRSDLPVTITKLKKLLKKVYANIFDYQLSIDKTFESLNQLYQDVQRPGRKYYREEAKQKVTYKSLLQQFEIDPKDKKNKKKKK